MGWGGVGWGMLTFVWTCWGSWCYADDGVGWGGVGHVNVCVNLLRLLMLRWWWGGVGWGMLTFVWTCWGSWCYADDGVGLGGVGHVNVRVNLLRLLMLRWWWGGMMLLWDIGAAKSSLEGKPPPESLAKIYKCEAQKHIVSVEKRTRTMLLTDGARCYPTFAKGLGLLHEAVAQNRGEFVRDVTRNREKLKAHTGTIDAAWTSCKKIVPKSLHARSADLILYCKMWQWRFIHKYKNLAKAPVSKLQEM